jgi:dTDP-4-amino-4,6-dideoxygalactose transaminase
MIPMVDLGRQYRDLKEEIDRAVQGVLDGAQFILGPNVAELEKEVAAYHGVAHAIGVANGTDALLLALEACGIGRGDEVITTPFTFIATAEVIARLGAVPVFADILPDTFNIDPRKIEEKITRKTKAVIPVHLFGLPADMDPIMGLCRRNGIRIIEGCAQALGAEYRGEKAGSFGDCGCFSFFPSKNLACYGDGGMVVTGDPDIAERIRLLRNHGSRVKYFHSMLGHNSRLDEIQAAIVRVKFRRIDSFNKARRKAAGLYRKFITREDVLLPGEEEGVRHVYHQFTVRSAFRDRLAACLKGNGVSSAIYYPVPLHRQEVFSGVMPTPDDLPHADACAREVLSLPMFPELSEEEIRHISSIVNKA